MGRKQVEKCIDVHVHVVKELGRGFNAHGEQICLGNGKIRCADGTEAQMFSEGLDCFTPEDVIRVLDENQVEKAVLMQGSMLGFNNEYTHAAQEKYKGRLFGMGTFDPYADFADQIMHRLGEEFGFVGFKFEISNYYGITGYHPGFRVDSERMDPVYRYCREKNMVISFDMSTFGHASMQADGLAKVAGQYPDVCFVSEHLFQPGSLEVEPQLKEALELLKPFENVYFTTAAVPAGLKPDTYPYPKANRMIELAAGIVGHKRLMWGTDMPQALVGFTYEDMKYHIADSGLFTDTELNDVMYENARRFYGI